MIEAALMPGFVRTNSESLDYLDWQHVLHSSRPGRPWLLHPKPFHGLARDCDWRRERRTVIVDYGGTLATAVSAPMIGRLIDRRGGRAVLIPAQLL